MNRKQILKVAIVLFFLFYFITINLVSLFRFWQFEVYYFDHSIFDQAIWHVSQFKPPLIDHLEKTPTLQITDHFAPVMYLLSPMYWFTQSYVIILIIQNLFVLGSSIVIFFTGKKVLKSTFLAFAITIAYSLFIGLQNAIIANFHTEMPALLTLSSALYMMSQKKWKWFGLFLLLTLGLKETFVSIGVMLGVYLVLTRQWKVGLLTIGGSLLYYVIAVKIILEGMLNTPYGYPLTIKDLGTTLVLFFTPSIKIDTLVTSFLSFGFLPLFDPFFLLVILQDYFGRFVLVNTPSRIDLGLHYNAIVSVLLAFGSIGGLRNIKEKLKIKTPVLYIYGIVLIVITCSVHHVRHAPLSLAYNKVFYTQTKNVDFLREFIGKIPNTGVVMTQNNLAPHLTHSHNVMLLREHYWDWMPEIIAIDIRPGQNPNNYWPLPPGRFEVLHQRLEKDQNYKKIEVTNKQLIYKKKKSVNKEVYPQFEKEDELL